VFGGGGGGGREREGGEGGERGGGEGRGARGEGRTCVRACVRACVHAPFDLPPIAYNANSRSWAFVTLPLCSGNKDHGNLLREHVCDTRLWARLRTDGGNLEWAPSRRADVASKGQLGN
jgi:hypothetical protein